MTLSSVSNHHSVITKQIGKQGATLGYNGANPRGAYIINYHRDSLNIHRGQSEIRKALRIFGR